MAFVWTRLCTEHPEPRIPNFMMTAGMASRHAIADVCRPYLACVVSVIGGSNFLRGNNSSRVAA